MLRTGIYGGTFNPIHNGHVLLSRMLLESGMLDELWLLVSPQNPFKVHDSLLPDQHRLHLARLATADIPGLHVSDFECHLPKPSYMVHTLEALRTQYPDREFLLIIGADNWQRFPQWYRHQEILAHHRIIVYPRRGYSMDHLPHNVLPAATPLIDISSTQIREQITHLAYQGEGLPPKVWEEIRNQGYYQPTL